MAWNVNKSISNYENLSENQKLDSTAYPGIPNYIVIISILTTVLSLITAFIISYHEFEYSFNTKNFLARKDTFARFFPLIEPLTIIIIREYVETIDAAIIIAILASHIC